MIKRFCDRCEKEIVGTSYKMEMYKEDLLFPKLNLFKRDICKECAEEVKIFIEEGEKTNETMA